MSDINSNLNFNYKLVILFLLVLILVPLVNSQVSLICCCREGSAQQASTLPSSSQCSTGFQAVNVTGANITVPNICTALCSSAQPVAVACGNNIVEAGEECDDGNTVSGDGCASNCVKEVFEACGAPGFKPAVQNLSVLPVKGEKAFLISLDTLCPVDSISVSRCKGSSCSDFKLVTLLGKENTYKDEDASLEWKSDYTYRVISNYVRQGPGTPSDAVSNLGDLECWEKTASDLFCISEFSYDKFKDYLASFGYSGISGKDFVANFKGQVDAIFSSGRFNVAWRCNERNILSREFGCSGNELCVADEHGAKCIKPSPCDDINPFGLYSSVDSCEGSDPNRKFCFFDRSNTSINSCFKCTQKMSCYDYRTSNACNKDNCGVGQCEWRPVFADLGTGVCVDARVVNCDLCDKSPVSDSPTLGAFNAIFDRCSPSKAVALSTQKHNCFALRDDKGKFVAKSCDNAVCSDFIETQCGSPAEGIVLNPDNSLKSRSSDVCNIGVCQFHASVGCFKNADGTNLSVVPFEDCKFGNNPINKTCERDYFPPLTTLVGVGKKSRFDALSIGIRDVLVKNGPAVNTTGKRGYETFMCITNGSSCNDFSKKVNVSKITIKNIELKVGNALFVPLSEGNNTVFFFSRDASNNIEKLKNMTFVACSSCSVPEVVGVNITDARFLSNKFFTSVKKPTILVSFDEDVIVQDVFLLENFNAVPLFQYTADFARIHSFAPTVDLEGTYNFSINVKNRNNLFLDDVYTFTLVVDTSYASFISSPSNGDVLKGVKDINVRINASKQIIAKSIRFVEEVFEDYFKRKISAEVGSQFIAVSNKSFSGTLKSLKEGKKTIFLGGEDFGGLPVSFEFFFIVANSPVDLILKSPGFGLASSNVFNLVVETSSEAVCKYLFDIPFAPSNETFNQFPGFSPSSDGRLHSVSNFDKLTKNLTPLHVYCKNDFGVSQKSFLLGFDTTKPQIVSAFVTPNVIGETVPDTNIYSTTLKVVTNELGYCKYGSSSVPFESMVPFPGYDEEPKNDHIVQVNVTEVKSYNYVVVCRDRAGLISDPKSVSFSVNPVTELGITFTTSPVANVTDILLALNTGKRAVCYHNSQPFSPGGFALSHTLAVSANGSGTSTFSVECSTPAGEKAEKSLSILVDLSPPEMLYVNDSTTYSGDPSISFFKNQTRVAFKGVDNETNVTKYVYSLVEQVSGNVVIDNVVSTKLDGLFSTITKDHNGVDLNLTNGVTYVFNAFAVNGVDSASDPVVSDGFIVDLSKRSAGCSNGVLDENETDVDCGKLCGDNCDEGKRCLRDLDCKSNICTSGVCAGQSCTDNIFSPLYESDKDCGKSCDKCFIGKRCADNIDCITNTCLGSVCRDESVCVDGVLSENSDETGVDCGGSCTNRCPSGQGCLSDSDCEGGLSCGEDNLCRGLDDEDDDGVADATDQCPKTPKGETVDGKGCSLSQKDSDSDGMSDAFELKYGLDINDASDASLNGDKDGLTNLEEFKKDTYPDNPDTDGDGWKDGDEVKKGFDPKNPLSHPTSIVRVLVKIFLVLLIIVIFGIIGYVLYDRFLKKRGVSPLFSPKGPLPFKPVMRMPQFKMPSFGPGESPKNEKIEKEESAIERLKRLKK